MKALEERGTRGKRVMRTGWYKRVMPRGELSCAVSVERQMMFSSFVTMCC